MLLFNLQEEPTTAVKDDKPLRLRRGMTKDSTDKMPIITFESLTEQISEGSYYDMTNIRVQRYVDERILKTTVTTKVSSDNDIEVTTNDDDDAYISPGETKIVDKVVVVDLKTLVQTYLCLDCNVSVSVENGLAWCNNCNNILAQSTCKSKAYLGLVVLKDNDQSKLDIDVSHSTIERKFDLCLSNTEQKVIVCKLINKNFLFIIDRFNTCAEFVDI